MNRSSGLTNFASTIVILISLLNIASAQSSSNWQWRDLTPASGQGPEARRNGVAIYDPVGKRVIIFGGVSNRGLLNDLWSFDPAARVWTKLNPAGTPPSPRFGFDAVYDPVGRQMVIYAGQGAGFFNDTWTLNLNTLEWRDVSPAPGSRPKARYGAWSVYDPGARSLVQFAGFTEESRRFQDTQSFSLETNTWQDLTPGGTKPEVRCLLTAALDRTNRRMIIYGGQRNGTLDDIWAFDLNSRAWTNLTPAQRPLGRWFTSSFVDRDGRFLIFGGFTSNGNVNETWAFDFQANSWTQLQIDNPPSMRNGMMSAYIESEDRLILFGGTGASGLLNDVWELSRRTEPIITTVSAASFDAAAIAVDSIVSGFGSNLAVTTQTATTLPLPTTLAGTSVKIKDSGGVEHNAPLFYVSPNQVNYLIPSGIGPGAASLTLTIDEAPIATGAFQIANVAPSLFSANAGGQGIAAAVALRIKADGSQSVEPIAQWDAAQNRFEATPIDVSAENEQVVLALFGTGVRYRSGLSSVSVRIGGIDTQVLFAGAQGDFAGLDQVNVNAPRSLAGRGEVDIVLSADGKQANTVKVYIK